MSISHSSPAQIIHQRWEDAAAVTFISQGIKHDETDGVQLWETRILQQTTNTLQEEETQTMTHSCSNRSSLRSLTVCVSVTSAFKQQIEKMILKKSCELVWGVKGRLKKSLENTKLSHLYKTKLNDNVINVNSNGPRVEPGGAPLLIVRCKRGISVVTDVKLFCD